MKGKCERYSSNANRTSRNKNKWYNSMYCTYWCEITLLPAAFLNLFSFRCEKCNKLGNMGPYTFVFVGELSLCFVA